jgi:predicted DNA-binding protein with PD1-like motif
MQFSQARPGRIFVLRLEDGEIVHEVVERFAQEQGIEAASLLILGGADDGSVLVVGPEKDRELPLQPTQTRLKNAHEIAGVGTLFRDENNVPLLHMHMACGRGEKAVVGCIRGGVKVWRVMEVIISEFTDCSARRLLEEPLGLKLLRP